MGVVPYRELWLCAFEECMFGGLVAVVWIECVVRVSWDNPGRG